MIKGTPELIAGRREEIINACEKLYQTMSFKEITLKEIGNELPFSRPTIYNYFETKEEIFLALFRREYERWIIDLDAIYNNNDSLAKEELASKIARSLADRPQLLKLIAMNIYDMEANSRIEQLTEFKRTYRRLIKTLGGIFDKFLIGRAEGEKKKLLYMFFSFVFGVYPMTNATEKQREAMKRAEIDFEQVDAYDLTKVFLLKLL
ncbi:MAG: TetR/AcrR family transcriptional regulator [Oscillospiraceae bacterium]|nr:TetR/AcrR family transcriptional regulator [Oscillospiraceae bacterium]